MKLKQILESWLDSFPIAQQAKTLGLTYAGYGRWKDKTGKIVAKTVDGKILSTMGTGDDTMMASSDNPNASTDAPIAGDSVNGHDNMTFPKHDSYVQEPSGPQRYQNIF